MLLRVAERARVVPDEGPLTRRAGARKIPRNHRANLRLRLDFDTRELQARHLVGRRAARKDR